MITTMNNTTPTADPAPVAAARTAQRTRPRRNRAQSIAPPAPGHFRVAQTIEQAVAAWQLVYKVYARSGFIGPNRFALHSAPQAVNRRAAVFYSQTGQNVDGTLTAMIDGPEGLPLDSVYGSELNDLRRRGRRLSEHGLLAHTGQIAGSQAAEYLDKDHAATARDQLNNVRTSLIHLMCRTVFYSLSSNCTDVVIGVHPKHTRFYERAWGFRKDGPERTYATVNNRPVVLMRLDFAEVFNRESLPYAMDFLLNNPIPMDTFAERCRFELREVTQSESPLRDYLRWKHPEWESRSNAWVERKVS
jgi:hypothetical protein